MIDTTEILEKTQEFWVKQLQSQSLNDLPVNLRKMMFCVPITESNRSTFSILNLKNFHPEFASQNTLEVMGYSAEDYVEQGLKLFMDNLDDSHKSFTLYISNWMETKFTNIPIQDRENVRLTYCGLRFHHATKKWIRLLVQQYFFEVDDNRNPLRFCTTKTDITHLMRHEKLWLRISYGASDTKHIETFDYQNQLRQKGDIISNREMDILLLLIEGLDIDDIGKQLFISPNTVKNHRQNMINRLGVKDTTALIQICRLCGIV